MRPFILTGCAVILLILLNPVASTQRGPIESGVITGRVTTLTGEPMIGAQVIAVLVKNLNGDPWGRESGERPRPTDDRGVYRLYGLRPGIYVVFTRGNSYPSQISPYEGYAPTYHPSSPRETAAEIKITSGTEATGIDIRYRGERGHTVSGAVSAVEASQPNTGVSVTLYNVSSGFLAGTGSVRQGDGQNAFTIKGVTDGEYEIIAQVHETLNDETIVSLPRRVTIRGADVGGIGLRLAPVASISGKVIVEASPNACESERKSSLGAIVVTARHDAKTTSAARRSAVSQFVGSVVVNGEFRISNLDPNRYFISLRMPDESWYVKSIAAPAAEPARESAVRSAPGNDVVRNGITVKSGDKVTGLAITITDGAVGLRGKVAMEKEGTPPPARMIVHLTPAEPASADDVLRYAEAVAGRDGVFEIKHIAPGKYRALVRAMPDDVSSDHFTAPIAWEAGERAKLRKEAEAMKIDIDLKPCQRVSDQVVKFR